LLSYHTKQNTKEDTLPMKNNINFLGCFHKQFLFLQNAPPWIRIVTCLLLHFFMEDIFMYEDIFELVTIAAQKRT